MYYETYFGLHEAPFSISPDPRYLYLTPGHREALAHLLYGVSGGGGFVLLTGEVGAGKTTVCRCLLQQLPEDVDVALILNPKLNVLEFHEAICDELGIKIHGDKEVSFKLVVDYIRKHLLVAHGKGRNTVLIVDEAQNLAPEVIEHLRLLTNLETDEKKLLQIILIGQPELRDLIDSPALSQMAQRITARFHLNLLSRLEAQGYVEHRLKVAGVEKKIFDSKSIKYIWLRSGGVPRLMNSICDRALLGASLANKKTVNKKIARRAANEVLGRQRGAEKRVFILPLRLAVLGFCLVAAVAIVATFGDRVLLKSWIGELPSRFTIPSFTINDDRDSKRLGAVDGETLRPQPQQDLTGASLSGNQESGSAFTTSLADLLHDNPGDGERLAVDQLFRQWGVAYTSRNRAADCDYAITQGLRCFGGSGNLQTLMTLNRPTVLGLRDKSQRLFKVTLLSIGDGKAVISLFDSNFLVPVDKLLELWTGEYLMIWRAPEAYKTIVKRGMEGDVVEWITTNLSGNGGNNPGRVYDRAVVERVKLFQQAHGLAPDGEVGPMTMIAINNFRGSSAPGLRGSSAQKFGHLPAAELSVATD